jgi:Asp/Glu/hydantoin racemase
VRILYVNPVGTRIFDGEMKKILDESAQKGTDVDVVSLRRGPWHLEYHYYESLVLVDILHKVKEAENGGYDATVLGCFYDVGLQEAREVSEQMVVTAPAESTMLTACSLGDKFSIIVGRRKWIPQMTSNVAKYGLSSRLASFRAIDTGVLDFQRRPEETRSRQLRAAREAVQKDGAEVIILGCTAEFGFWKELQRKLGVPVLDPVITAFKHAEYLAGLKNGFGWSHSKLGGYESPPLEEISAWKLEEQYGTNVWSGQYERGQRVVKRQTR